MTPRERAEDLYERMKALNFSDGLITTVEQAITAAVEEARAEQASITAKAERDECLKILQKVYQEWFDGDWSPGEA